MANGHGGRRPGAGRKPKEQAEELTALLDECWPVEDRKESIRVLGRFARSGNIKANSLLLSYAYGKPLERKELSGPDGEPLIHSIIHHVDGS